MGWLNSWKEFTGGIKKVGNSISSGIKQLGRNIDTHVFQQIKNHPWEAMGWVLAPGLMPFVKGAQEMFKPEPPDPPEINSPPVPGQAQAADVQSIEAEERKKRKGVSGTLLTGGGGLTEKGRIYRKTMLGG